MSSLSLDQQTLFSGFVLLRSEMKAEVRVVSADLTRGEMTEFKEKLRQQHEESMHRELEALLKTTNGAEAEVRRSNAPKQPQLIHS